jgi:hypothetical protein
MMQGMIYRIGIFFIIVLALGGGFIWGVQYLPDTETLWREASSVLATSTETFDIFIPDEGEVTPGVETASGTPTLLPGVATDRVDQATSSGGTTTSNDWLTPGQRQLLATFGIDVASLPQELTPVLRACLVEAWGEVRFSLIISGETPTVFEGARAVSCL